MISAQSHRESGLYRVGGCSEKPQAEGCAWLEHWLLPVATGMVTLWCGQSCQGAPAAPGPFGLPQVPLGWPRSLWAGPALQLAHGSALGQVSARHSLYDHRQKQFSASPGPYGSKPWCVSTCCTPGQCWKLSRGCRVLGWATALGWATPSSGAA